MMGGCCRVGVPHSKKGLRSDLRKKGGGQAQGSGWVRMPGSKAALPCFFLYFLAKCFMTPQ